MRVAFPNPAQAQGLKQAAREVKAAKAGASQDTASPIDNFVTLERQHGIALLSIIDRALSAISRVLRGQETLTSTVQVRKGVKPGHLISMHNLAWGFDICSPVLTCFPRRCNLPNHPGPFTLYPTIQTTPNHPKPSSTSSPPPGDWRHTDAVIPTTTTHPTPSPRRLVAP